MSDESWHEDAAKEARILQLIVGAMGVGTTLYLAVAQSIGPGVNLTDPLQPILLTLVVLIFVGIGMIARLFLMSQIARKARREIANDARQSSDPMVGASPLLPPAVEADFVQHRNAQCLLLAFRYKTIASAAMFEGWAFLAVTANLIEGNLVSLGLAALLTLGVVAHLPTQARTIRWVERQRDKLDQEERHNVN
jgi:hypothetical protein